MKGIFLSILNTKVKTPKFLVYLGRISYGLYLFHMFWIWLLTEQKGVPILRYHPYRGYVVAFVLTVVSASVSYHFFERPILKFKERFETIRTRPA
jgi:peptidoglycan/LPS O-acetylase OafA/YrhL